MSRQLATMVSSGMTILRALYVLEEQTENKKLAETLVARPQGRRGRPAALATALERHPKVFNPLFVAMVAPGETGGRARGVAAARRRPAREGGVAAPPGQVGDGLPDRRSSRSRSIVMIALVAFIVPVFAGVFKEFGGKLPAMTQFTVGISNVVTGYWYLLIVGTVGVVVGFRKWKKSPRGRPQWDRFRLRIPFKIGDDRPEGRARPLVAHVLRADRRRRAAPAGDRHHRQTAGNIVVEEAMDDVTTSVKAGGTIAAPLHGRAGLPVDGRPHGQRRRGDRRARRRCSRRSATSTRTRSRRRSRR